MQKVSAAFLRQHSLAFGFCFVPQISTHMGAVPRVTSDHYYYYLTYIIEALAAATISFYCCSINYHSQPACLILVILLLTSLPQHRGRSTIHPGGGWFAGPRHKKGDECTHHRWDAWSLREMFSEGDALGIWQLGSIWQHFHPSTLDKMKAAHLKDKARKTKAGRPSKLRDYIRDQTSLWIN